MTAFSETDHPRVVTGQFTHKQNSAPSGALAASAPKVASDDDELCARCDDVVVDADLCRRHSDERQFGATGLKQGSRTPWGSADYVDEIVPGKVHSDDTARLLRHVPS